MDPQDQQEQEQEGSMMQELFKNIIQLNKERLECEKNFQFVDAGRIKDHLKKLGEEYVRVSLHSIREKQQGEKNGLEAEYEKELDQLNSKWETELNTNEEQAQAQFQEIQQRQAQEMAEFQEKLKKEVPNQVKMSSEVLNLEYQVSVLVKDQRYNEAAIVQKKLEKLRDQVILKANSGIDDSIRLKLEAASKKQENEMVAIEKRINSNRDLLIRAKDEEFERLNSKFRVYREKLENNHINEFLREEKKLKSFNPCSNSLAYEEGGE